MVKLPYIENDLGQPSAGRDFALHSLDQVFIGRHLTRADTYSGDRRYRWHLERPTTALGPTDASTSLESLLHGLNPEARLVKPEREQLGLGRPRIPSPMIWRLHPCAAGGHLPVMTWSPVGYRPGDEPRIRSTEAPDLDRYLSGSLGFAASLAGHPLVA
jgi:hypothetical protein